MDWKLNILCDDALFDISNSFESINHKITQKSVYGGISYVSTPHGNLPILKIMQTNICKFNCMYCANRQDSNLQRTYIQPDDLAKVFMKMYESNLVKGLFLTSGINNNPEWTMSKMLDTVTILRKKYQFNGYIHLKILPGVSDEAIHQAYSLATRISINLESSKEEFLRIIAPEKSILQTSLPVLKIINSNYERIKKDKLLIGGITTQFVVGANNDDSNYETDMDIIRSSEWLYKKMNLRRAYYSGFNPIKGTPLENKNPESPIRINRLYQADFLLRFYGFNLNDLSFDQKGNLSKETDPKTLYAKNHIDLFPIEINTAPYEMLINVPGIGIRSAKKIIERRKISKITDISTLKQLGIYTKKVENYLLLNGRIEKEPMLF